MKLVRPRKTASPDTQEWLDQMPSPGTQVLIIVGCGVAMLAVALILIKLGVV